MNKYTNREQAIVCKGYLTTVRWPPRSLTPGNISVNSVFFERQKGLTFETNFIHVWFSVCIYWPWAILRTFCTPKTLIYRIYKSKSRIVSCSMPWLKACTTYIWWDMLTFNRRCIITWNPTPCSSTLVFHIWKSISPSLCFKRSSVCKPVYDIVMHYDMMVALIIRSNETHN